MKPKTMPKPIKTKTSIPAIASTVPKVHLHKHEEELVRLALHHHAASAVHSRASNELWESNETMKRVQKRVLALLLDADQNPTKPTAKKSK